MKKTVAFLALVMTAAALHASGFSVSSPDIKVYDHEGHAMALDASTAAKASNGWVVQSGASPVLVRTPVGTVLLEAGSTLVTGDLDATHPSLYLVDGEASFLTDPSFQGVLSISTPVTRYDVRQGDLLVTTTADEESMCLFSGSAYVVNGLTHRDLRVSAMHMIDLSSDAITPLSDSDRELLEAAKGTRVPASPASLSVTSVKPYTGELPSGPQQVTVLAPAAPTSLHVAETVETIEITAIPAPATVEAPAAEPVAEPEQKQEVAAVSEKPARKESTSFIGARLTYEFDRSSEEVLTRTDERLYDDWKKDDRLHTFTIEPYFASPSFAIGLRAYYQTFDFGDWNRTASMNASHFTHDSWLDSVAMIDSYLSYLRIGRKDGNLWLAIDDEGIDEDGQILNGPSFVKPDLHRLSLGMRFGSVRIKGTFDDTSLFNLRVNKQLGDSSTDYQRWQYGNLSLGLTDGDRTVFSMGAVFGVNDKKRDYGFSDGKESYAVGYPYVEATIPFLSADHALHFNLIGAAGTYLPLAPDTDFDKVYDSDEEEFPNYHVAGGFSFGSRDLDVALLASKHEGKAYPFVRGPFTTIYGNDAMVAYDSTVDVRAAVTYRFQNLSLGVMYNLPFVQDGDVSDDHLARMKADGKRHADLLAFAGSWSGYGFTVKTGFEFYGVGDIDSMDKDKFSTGFASLGYDYHSWLHAEVGVRKLIDQQVSFRLEEKKNLYAYALVGITLQKGL